MMMFFDVRHNRKNSVPFSFIVPLISIATIAKSYFYSKIRKETDILLSNDMTVNTGANNDNTSAISSVPEVSALPNESLTGVDLDAWIVSVKRKFLLGSPLKSDELRYISNNKSEFSQLLKRQGDRLLQDFRDVDFYLDNGNFVFRDGAVSEEIREVSVSYHYDYFFSQNKDDYDALSNITRDTNLNSIFNLSTGGRQNVNNGVVTMKRALLKNRGKIHNYISSGKTYLVKAGTRLYCTGSVLIYPLIDTTNARFIGTKIEKNINFSGDERIYDLSQMSGSVIDFYRYDETVVKKKRRLFFGLFGPRKKTYIRVHRFSPKKVKASINYYIIQLQSSPSAAVFLRSINERK